MFDARRWQPLLYPCSSTLFRILLYYLMENRFRVVHDRVHDASEGSSTKWQGPFSFVQMADTQLGMFHADREWDEEVV